VLAVIYRGSVVVESAVSQQAVVAAVYTCNHLLFLVKEFKHSRSLIEEVRLSTRDSLTISIYREKSFGGSSTNIVPIIHIHQKGNDFFQNPKKIGIKYISLHKQWPVYIRNTSCAA
jgi:hypothetical protein